MKAIVEVSAMNVSRGDVLLDADHLLFGVVWSNRTWPGQCRIESVNSRAITFTEFDASDYVAVLREVQP